VPSLAPPAGSDLRVRGDCLEGAADRLEVLVVFLAAPVVPLAAPVVLVDRRADDALVAARRVVVVALAAPDAGAVEREAVAPRLAPGERDAAGRVVAFGATGAAAAPPSRAARRA
jgi:hypothetical protein